jgi:hypothetical protein
VAVASLGTFSRKLDELCSGMRFEIISNDLKCILFEKYGFLKIKSPIHVYQYEIPLPRLSMNLTQECILSLSNVSDTPVDSATLYLHRIRSSSVVVEIITCEAMFDAPESRDKPSAKTNSWHSE